MFEVARRGIAPVIIGGDHSITWPAATAVADHHGWGNVGIVHFDAHADTADILEGNLASHGTPMRRLIESGAVQGRHFVQVGLRGYWPPAEVFAWMQEQGMRWHLMQEIWERGSKAVIEDAIGEALDGADNLYLSVDIDVLDPGFAPGTGTPEPGGMNPADLLRAVRQITLDANVVALDVVEVSPPYDWADTTINNAHRVRHRVPRGTRGEEASRGPVTGAGAPPPTGAGVWQSAGFPRGAEEGQMRFRLAAVGAAATLTMLGLVACGDDSASSSEPTTLTVTAS